MNMLSGRIGNKEIVILYEGDWSPCHLYIKLLEPFEMVLTDDTFPNLWKLSADFACDVATGPARDFLHDHNVPKESMLWSLNHAGWAPDMRIEQPEEEAVAAPRFR